MTQPTTPPEFHVHPRTPALARGLWIAGLCAALTAGFLAQTWRAPTEAELHAAACRKAMQAHACGTPVADARTIPLASRSR